VGGQPHRPRDWISRALLLEPDNISMRYNLACSLLADLGDNEAALELLGPYFEKVISPMQLKHADVDPDLDPVREDQRFAEMVTAAKQRLGITAS
jgi:adenylate cyclase